MGRPKRQLRLRVSVLYCTDFIINAFKTCYIFAASFWRRTCCLSSFVLCGKGAAVLLLYASNSYKRSIFYSKTSETKHLYVNRILILFPDKMICYVILMFISDYLLSNNHVNSIIVHKFDFSDEEVMAYYISFLKTLSFKLNGHTIHFFYNEVSSLINYSLANL